MKKLTKEIKAICQPSFFAMLPKCHTHITKNALHELAACFASPCTKSPSATAKPRHSEPQKLDEEIYKLNHGDLKPENFAVMLEC